MYMFVSFFMFVFILVESYSYGDGNMENPCRTKESELIINEVMDSIQEDLFKKYNIESLWGETKVATWTNIPKLKFKIRGPLSKEKLRLILTEEVEKFINLINSNEKLSPFIEKHPLTFNAIEAGIVVTDRKDEVIYYPDIAIALLLRGKIYFNTIDRDLAYGYKTTDIEDYEEALKIVRSKK